MIRSLHMTRVVIVVVSLGMAACGDGRDKNPDKASFQNHKLLAAEVAKADKVVLYEGLPHQGNERKLFDEETKTKKTVERHGFPFYSEPLPLEDGDAKELTKLFTDEKSFKAFSGEKKCGGFHPDY